MVGWSRGVFMILKDLPASERPREKLLREGASSLSNVELIALLLGSGSRGESVLILAQRVLHLFPGGLREFRKISSTKLMQVAGIGPAKCAVLLAAVEFSSRLEREEIPTPEMIRSPQSVYTYLRPKIAHLAKEVFVVLCLHTAGALIHEEIISMGTINQSIVHPREVFVSAVHHQAASILVAHNHPSGTLEPSRDDLAVTRRICEAGELLGIPLTDHLIITQSDCLSFREKGLL